MSEFKHQLRVVSLFSGCGGLDLGFKRAGFTLTYAADNDRAAVDVYRRNVHQEAFVRDVASEEFHSDVNALRTTDVVIGGFPCQGFSKAGPKQVHDKRNVLYTEMVRAVQTLEPSAFVAENVDGLSQNFGGAYVEKIRGDFGRLGFDVDVRILNAAGYGVPQYRRRVFFIGLRRSAALKFHWPKESHLAIDRNGEFRIDRAPSLWDGLEDSRVEVSAPVTMRHAISDITRLSGAIPDHRVDDSWPKKYEHVFSAIGPGQKLCNVRHSKTSVYTWQIPGAFGETTSRQVRILETIAKNRRHKRYGSVPNGNPLPALEIELLTGLSDISADLTRLEDMGYLKLLGDAYDLKGAMFCSGLFKRPNWDEPSPTVLTNFHNPRYFLHPQENRPFSLRECARLQGFPDDFRLGSEAGKDSLLAGYRLVGNAVPPPLGERIASELRASLTQSAVRAA